MTFVFHGHSTAAKRNLILERTVFSHIDRVILANAMFLHFIIYAVIIIILLQQYRRQLKMFFSSIEKLRLNWLNFLIDGFLFVWLLAYFRYQWRQLTGYNLMNTIYFIMAIFLFANLVVFFGLKQPEIFTDIQTWSKNKKYKKSTLSDKMRMKYLKIITNYIKIHKPYLDPNLTINDLAQKIKISPRHLSQTINESFHTNFYEFINSYRIEESKRIFSDPVKGKKTILEVLYDVGFNSKSVFNTYFKKYAGITPTEFKKNYQH
jgi:AraC-like DNA-binding protein